MRDRRSLSAIGVIHALISVWNAKPLTAAELHPLPLRALTNLKLGGRQLMSVLERGRTCVPDRKAKAYLEFLNNLCPSYLRSRLT